MLNLVRMTCFKPGDTVRIRAASRAARLASCVLAANEDLIHP